MSDRSPAPDPVCLAVGLGWLLAELYDSKRLPGLEAALGLGMPTAKSIQAVLDTPGHARGDVRRAVHDLYLDIRNRLAGTDPAAALAFGLGRMLADTTLLPESAEPQVLAERFERYRIANALSWLDDLDAELPARSASAVRVSLRRWESWVADRCDPVGRIAPAMIDTVIIRALRQQGCVWRRLLTGQQAADQLLDGRAYVGAAASLLANGRRLAFHYVWKWSWAILAAAAAVGANPDQRAPSLPMRAWPHGHERRRACRG